LNPLMSVLIPTSGRSPYFQKTVDSLIKQSEKNFEVVIVVDGPYLDSEIIDKIENDKRFSIFFIERKESGLGYIGSLLNFAAEKANSQLLARIDDDDIAHLDWLSKLHYELDSGGHDLVGCQSFLINEVDNYLGFTTLPLHLRDIKLFAMFENPFFHSGVLMRKSVFTKLNGYAISQNSQDYDLWLRMISAGYMLHNSRSFLIAHRLHNASITAFNRDPSRELFISTIQMRFRELNDESELFSKGHSGLARLLLRNHKLYWPLMHKVKKRYFLPIGLSFLQFLLYFLGLKLTSRIFFNIGFRIEKNFSLHKFSRNN
jgi:glycosyltransferase involved in cell wall biosynthesis